MVEVFLSKALICFLGVCYPALIGERTPTGTFQIEHVYLRNRRGHYDVLMFAPSRPGRIFAIHRTPSTKRAALLRAQSKVPVTLGCVNVSPEVFEKLRDCCSNAKLVIR